jgi:hypothetical protein
VEIGSKYAIGKQPHNSVKNTPNAFKNTLKWFALIFEVF